MTFWLELHCSAKRDESCENQNGNGEGLGILTNDPWDYVRAGVRFLERDARGRGWKQFADGRKAGKRWICPRCQS